MINKITLASLTTMALLFIPAQAEGMAKCGAGKCGSGMMEKTKTQNKMHKKRHSSSLLMHLPSPMRAIMKYGNDPKLALTAEQKSKLESQRKEMMPKMMKLKTEIKALKKEIKGVCRNSTTAAEQKANVEKLGQLKTQATMMKLRCIEGVKTTLSKEQCKTLKSLKKSKAPKKTDMKKDKKC